MLGLLIGVFLLLSLGCDKAIVKYYEGQNKTNKDISIIYQDVKKGVVIHSVDDKAIANTWTTFRGYVGVKELHLPPGEHKVSGVAGGYAYFSEAYKFSAGSRYRLEFEIIDGFKPKIIFIKIDSSKK